MEYTLTMPHLFLTESIVVVYFIAFAHRYTLARDLMLQNVQCIYFSHTT